MTTRVVVLGAGFGGLELSTCLSEQLPGEVDVVLIDKSDSFVFGFAKFDVLFGRATPEQVRAYYRDISLPGVTFRQETVTSIDPTAKHVVTDGGEYDADVLVVALGADTDPSLTPGFVEGAHEFYSVAGAENLRPILSNFAGGRIVIGVLGTPYKCPPAPCEAAFMLDDFYRHRGVDVSIQVVSPLPSPVPISKPTSDAILEGFAEQGIEFLPQRIITSIDPATKTALRADGEAMPYDLFLGIPKHRVPPVVEQAGLAVDGWIPVDQTNLMTRFPDVYAVGDCNSAPVPRAGVFAEGAGRAAARDIVARIRNSGSAAPYDGAGSCYIEFAEGMVARVDADFLTGPTPTGPFTPPSKELVAEKKFFGTSRRKRWFGYDD